LDSQTTDADEKHILRIANEIIDDLNISIFRLNSVVWTEDLPITLVDTETPVPEMAGMVRRDVPVGWSVFTWDRVILNPQMKGKLSPAEWRPLLVSSLIYEARLRGRRDLATILAWTPFIIDGIGWWWLFAVWTSEPGIPALLAITDSVGLIAAFLVGGLLSRWLSKRLRLEADNLASALVGLEILKRVLEKMESLGLADGYAGSLWGMGYPFSGELMSGRPTLAERIRNLEGRREAGARLAIPDGKSNCTLWRLVGFLPRSPKLSYLPAFY